jgi:hypothetical protein
MSVSELQPNQQAPMQPTTEMLHRVHPLSSMASRAVAEKRMAVSDAYADPDSAFVTMPGYCARPGKSEMRRIMHEGQAVAHWEYNASGLIALHRGPTWKPRSNPEDWHGEETTDPEGAFQTVTSEAEYLGHVAMEIGYMAQLQRYASRLAVAWWGGRNVKNDELIKSMALHDPLLPVGGKNGLDGDWQLALDKVTMVNDMRGPDDAPAFLMYRGGNNAKTPSDWEDNYIAAWEATEGRLMVDLGHGTEMAHDPTGRFEKSVAGQILAGDHLIELDERGYAPFAVTMEASDKQGPMDPEMPLAIARNLSLSLLAAKLDRRVAAAA